MVDRLNVSRSGPQGARTLVFVHGFGCDQAMWRFVAPTFADRFDVVTLDLVGAGGSDVDAYDPERYASLAAHADDVAGLCEELDLHDAVVVGHSVAATIAVLAANAHPDRIGGLVLVCPSPRFIDEDGYVGGFSRTDIDELLEAQAGNHLGWSAQVAPMIMGTPDRPELGEELTGSFCRMRPDIAQHFAGVTFRADNRADFTAVTAPTLVLESRQDAIAPPEVGRWVHAAIAGSELVTLDSVGHCPNLSAPEATAAAIATFTG